MCDLFATIRTTSKLLSLLSIYGNIIANHGKHISLLSFSRFFIGAKALVIIRCFNTSLFLTSAYIFGIRTLFSIRFIVLKCMKQN